MVGSINNHLKAKTVSTPAGDHRLFTVGVLYKSFGLRSLHILW